MLGKTEILIVIFVLLLVFYIVITLGEGKKEKKYADWITELVCKHFEVSKKEATDYLQIFYMTKEGKSNLKEIISLYGIEESMIKKLRL